MPATVTASFASTCMRRIRAVENRSKLYFSLNPSVQNNSLLNGVILHGGVRTQEKEEAIGNYAECIIGQKYLLLQGASRSLHVLNISSHTIHQVDTAYP